MLSQSDFERAFFILCPSIDSFSAYDIRLLLAFWKIQQEGAVRKICF